MFCQTCGEEITEGARFCGKCGKPLQTTKPSSDDPGIQIIFPYKNPYALVAYYLGIFSLIPFIGFPMGIAALILGIKGLKWAKQNPQAKGKAHAWVGIIMGGFFGFLYLVLIGMILFSILKR